MFIKEQTNNKIKLNSSQIKLALMEYFRYKKEYWGVVSEFVYYIGEIEDFVAFRNNDIAVVEIKISKSDFIADFKKIKHQKSYKRWFNYFYFCVTEDLKDFALNYLRENGYKGYGLLVANCGIEKPYISVAKYPKRHHLRTLGLFHNDNRFFLESLVGRMSSELIIAKRGD